MKNKPQKEAKKPSQKTNKYWYIALIYDKLIVKDYDLKKHDRQIRNKEISAKLVRYPNCYLRVSEQPIRNSMNSEVLCRWHFSGTMSRTSAVKKVIKVIPQWFQVRWQYWTAKDHMLLDEKGDYLVKVTK